MNGTFKPQYKPADFDPFSGPEIHRAIPLTQSQIEIWLSCVLGGDQANSAYNESNSLRLKGPLDVKAFERAMATLVERHESLRSSFSGDGKNMLVYQNLPNQFSYRDISGLSDLGKAEVLQKHLLADALHVFDLVKGPLFRATLLKTAENEHHFTFTAHHLIIDGWSIGVVIEELGKLYTAYAQGMSPDLPSPKAFSEFAREQNLFLESQQYTEVENFWLNLFKDKVPVLDLPTDRPRPLTRTYKSSRLDHELDGALVASLKKVGVNAGCTFVNILMNAFEVFLYRITGQEDIIIGLPASEQAFTGHYHLVGHCVNLLPLRSQPSGKMGFSEYLSLRKPAIYDAYENQQLTFGSLLKNLKTSRDPSRIPLVPVIFNVDIGMDEGVDFHNLELEMISNTKEYLNFEWFLNVNGFGKSVVLEWTYNSQLFGPETMQQMMDGFISLLHQIVLDPSIKIKDVLLPDHNLPEKLTEWNNTGKDFPKDTPFTEFIHDVAKKQPKKTAIQFYDQEITYQELEEKSNQLAAYLIGKGIQLGDMIGVSLDRSPGMVIVLLGIVKAGAAYLPLDPEYPKERIEYMLKDSKAKLLITNQRLKGSFDSPTEEDPIEAIWKKLSGFSKKYSDVKLDGKSLAYTLYTSGSTGNPKGVQIEHYSLVNFLLSMQIAPGIHSDDRVLAITTISFDIAGLELFLPLISGATLILADTETARDGRLLLRWIGEKKVSFMQATPATWRMLLNAGWDRPFPLKALSGGEALTPDLAEKLLAKCKSVWNVYGPTETTIWSTLKELTSEDKVLSIGRPIHNTQIYLLDEGRTLVPEGSVGEIYIGGDGVARGYLNREDLTEERFFSDPFTETKNARMYRTGDLGKFLENGEIICLGRIDHQVKIRGHRIELGEIEKSIGEFGDVKEAVVMAQEDQSWNKRLVAYLILDSRINAQDIKPTKDQVSRWKNELEKSLPIYMVPNDWIILEKFPLTSNNKIDRKSLPTPTHSMDREEFTSQLPKSNRQKLVAEIWSKSLQVSNISLGDDFFELGGHSLVAVEVMTLIEKKTGKILPLDSLFKYPTLEEFSKLIEDDQKENGEEWSSLVPIKPDGNKPPIYLIHAAGCHVSTYYLLAKKMDPDQPVFGIQAKGLNGIDQPLTTIEEIAAYYLSEVMAHNPNGPYYIGGHSFGGYVAFEMAKQIRKMNREVKKLFLFDIAAYQSETKLNSWQRFQRRISEEVKKRIVEVNLLCNAPETFIGLKKSSFENKRKKLKNFFKVNKDGIDTDRFQTIERIRKINHHAMDNYLLSLYDGDIYLFKAQIQNFYVTDKMYYGWKSYVNKIHIVELPGDHNSMFKDPIVEELGRKLQEILDN
ncbi:MAG: amino acid adenylation domain-containing protein [Anditalea sp.]